MALCATERSPNAWPVGQRQAGGTLLRVRACVPVWCLLRWLRGVLKVDSGRVELWVSDEEGPDRGTRIVGAVGGRCLR